MNADTLHPQTLPFSPAALRWAREWRGRSVEEAAQKVNVNDEKLRSWERGEAVPTVRQARILASFYERAFLEFFLSRLPNVAPSRLVPDFRLHKQAPDPRGDREIQAIQDWAEETRHSALDLFTLVADPVPTLPPELQATLDSHPDYVASEARRLSGFSIEEQMSLKSAQRGRVPKEVRHAMERLGILVLKDPELGKYGVRGLTLFAEPLPVVVFGTEAPTAQSFTLAHELGHIVLRQSAISGPPSARVATTEAERSEKWCDKFAGAFLIPSGALGAIWARPNEPQPQVGDQFLAQLANAFSVSRHAMMIRLVHLNYVEESFYWNQKRPEFLQQEADFKGGGRPLYYGSRFRNSLGDLYTGLVLDAWGNDRITNHNAAELMGIKSLSHLYDIRDNFFS